MRSIRGVRPKDLPTSACPASVEEHADERASIHRTSAGRLPSMLQGHATTRRNRATVNGHRDRAESRWNFIPLLGRARPPATRANRRAELGVLPPLWRIIMRKPFLRFSSLLLRSRSALFAIGAGVLGRVRQDLPNLLPTLTRVPAAAAVGPAAGAESSGSGSGTGDGSLFNNVGGGEGRRDPGLLGGSTSSSTSSPKTASTSTHGGRSPDRRRWAYVARHDAELDGGLARRDGLGQHLERRHVEAIFKVST